jgi:hypothetical protein
MKKLFQQTLLCFLKLLAILTNFHIIGSELGLVQQPIVLLEKYFSSCVQQEMNSRKTQKYSKNNSKVY